MLESLKEALVVPLNATLMFVLKNNASKTHHLKYNGHLVKTKLIKHRYDLEY